MNIRVDGPAAPLPPAATSEEAGAPSPHNLPRDEAQVAEGAAAP